MSFLGSLFKKLKQIISKIAKWLKDNIFAVLVAVLVVIAIFFPPAWAAVTGWISVAWSWATGALASVATFFAKLGPMGAISAAAGLGTLINPEGMGDALSSVIGGAGDAAGSVLSALGVPGLLMLGVGGFILFKLLTARREDDDISRQSSAA